MQNNAEVIDVLNNNHIESIFNKTCNEVSNRLIGNMNSTIAQIPVLPNIIQIAGESVPMATISQVEPVINTPTIPISPYYKLFGYEFSLWMLILGLLILLTIIYFIYKWFFLPTEQIVVITKSKDTPKLTTTKNTENLNEEITDSDSDSDSETNANNS